MLSKKYLIGLVIIYVIIGVVAWNIGFIETSNLSEQLFSFFYIILLWPIAIGAKMIWENYVLSLL